MYIIDEQNEKYNQQGYFAWTKLYLSPLFSLYDPFVTPCIFLVYSQWFTSNNLAISYYKIMTKMLIKKNTTSNYYCPMQQHRLEMYILYGNKI